MSRGCSMSSGLDSSYAGNAELLPYPLCIRKPSNRSQLTSVRSELIVRKKRSNFNIVTPRTENIRPTVPQRKSSLKLRFPPKIRVSGQSIRSTAEMPWQSVRGAEDQHMKPPRRRVVSKHRMLNRLASGFGNVPNRPIGTNDTIENYYRDKGLVGRSLYGSQSYVNLGSLIDSFPVPPREPLRAAPAQADTRRANHHPAAYVQTSRRLHEDNPLGATSHVGPAQPSLLRDCRAEPSRDEDETRPDLLEEDMDTGDMESVLLMQEAHRCDSHSFNSEATLRPVLLPSSTAHQALAYHPRRRRATSRTTVRESWMPELRIVVDGWTGSRGLECEREWQTCTAQALKRILSASGVAVSDVYFDFSRRDDGDEVGDVETNEGDGCDDDADDDDDENWEERYGIDVPRPRTRRAFARPETTEPLAGGVGNAIY